MNKFQRTLTLPLALWHGKEAHASCSKQKGHIIVNLITKVLSKESEWSIEGYIFLCKDLCMDCRTTELELIPTSYRHARSECRDWFSNALGGSFSNNKLPHHARVVHDVVMIGWQCAAPQLHEGDCICQQYWWHVVSVWNMTPPGLTTKLVAPVGSKHITWEVHSQNSPANQTV